MAVPPTPGLPPPDDRLSGWLDGELDDAGRAEVDGLLAQSEQWRAELDAVSWARDRLRGLPPREAPAGFWDQVLGQDDGATVTSIAAARSRRRLRWAGAAAAVAVAAGVIGVVVTPSSTPDRVQPAVATFTDAHAVRSSIGADPITHLAPMAALTGLPGVGESGR